MPIAPAAAPMSAPPKVDATRYQPIVRPNRVLRARSPSGLMLASIDSPHGDQDERSPATAATTTPATVTPTDVTATPRPSRPLVVARPGRGSGRRARCPPVATPRRRPRRGRRPATRVLAGGTGPAPRRP